jgi:PIN domain nuclease of toxin-antitoxin system
LLDNGYVELPVTSQHAVSIDVLPPLHKDPFDRLLLAQARSEGITLLTSDGPLARYPRACAQGLDLPWRSPGNGELSSTTYSIE